MLLLICLATKFFIENETWSILKRSTYCFQENANLYIILFQNAILYDQYRKSDQLFEI